MKPRVIVQPDGELLTIEECRAQLNVTPYVLDSDGAGTHPDDALIMAMLGAAREHCENFLGLSLVQRTYEIALDSFPIGAMGIELPMGPVVSVESVVVGEEDSDSLVDAGTYIFDVFSAPGRIVPVTTWPLMFPASNAVRIRYVAGYGDDTDSEPLPFAIRAAILLMLGHLYKNREDTVEGVISSLPNGVEALLRPLRVRLGMA
jgi:uncharacterized phiE125 gp8 family phage protein